MALKMTCGFCFGSLFGRFDRCDVEEVVATEFERAVAFYPHRTSPQATNLKESVLVAAASSREVATHDLSQCPTLSPCDYVPEDSALTVWHCLRCGPLEQEGGLRTVARSCAGNLKEFKCRALV